MFHAHSRRILAILLAGLPAVTTLATVAPTAPPATTDVENFEQVLELGAQVDLVGTWLQTMGIAVSPYLGMAIAATAGNVAAQPAAGEAMPWVYSPGTLVLMWLVVGVLWLKDSLLTFLGPLKMPLDALAIVLQDLGGLIGVVFSGALFFAAITSGGGVGIALAELTTGALMLVFYFCIFVTFGTFDVLILLSPVPLIDTALTGFRTVVVTVFFAAAWLHPLFGLVAVSPILLFSLWAAGRSARFGLAGLTFAADFLFRRWRSLDLQPSAEPLAFSAGKRWGAPTQVRGTLRRDPTGNLVCSYRRWLVGPQRCVVLEVGGRPLWIGRGSLWPVLLSTDRAGSVVACFRFAPRYRGHEERLAELLGAEGVRDVSLGRGLRDLLGAGRVKLASLAGPGAV